MIYVLVAKQTDYYGCVNVELICYADNGGYEQLKKVKSHRENTFIPSVVFRAVEYEIRKVHKFI